MSEESLKHVVVLRDMRNECHHDEEVEALNAAIKALEANTRHTEEKSDWISVETRLPEEGWEVLWCEKGFSPSIATFEDGKWLNRYGIELRGITHWMPLPEGPK